MTNDIAAWYEKYGPMVFRRCRDMLDNEDEAKDAVQDVFLNLLKVKRLSISYPSSYLYTSATRVCLNRLRAKKRKERDHADGEKVFSDPDGSYEQTDAELLVKAIFQDESEDTRTICYMYYFDGMTFEEIGKNMGMSKSWAEKKLAAFRERARLKLDKDKQ